MKSSYNREGVIQMGVNYRIVYTEVENDKTISAYSQTPEQQEQMSGSHIADFVVWQDGENHCVVFNPASSAYAMTIIKPDYSCSMGTVGLIDTNADDLMVFDDIPNHVIDVVAERLHKKIANHGYQL